MQFSLSTFPPRRLRVLVLAVLSAALMVAPFSQAQAVPTWQISTVDAAGDVGQYTSLALDASGFPVISYYETIDVATGRLKLMHCNDVLCSGNNESIVTVDGTGAAGTSVGTYTSLVLDANGFPVISYRDSTNTNLMLVHCNDINCAGNNESIVTIDGLGGLNVGQYNSLALDASGFPVISYNDSTNADLKLVHCNDVNCVGNNESIVTVDGTGGVNVGQYTSLKLNGGNPVISYYDATNGDLKLVRCDDPNCAGGNDVPQLIDGGGAVGPDVGQYTSLQLDAGKAVISYRYNVGDLYLARCNDVACTTNTVQLVDSTGSTGSYSSLKLTATGLPVISYRNATGGFLRLAKCSTADCSGTKDLQTVDGTGNVGEYTSLALDAAGLAVISYRDANVANLDLKLARQVDGANVAPVAISPAPVTTLEDTAVNITLTATDANGDALTYTIVTPPAHGTLTGANAAKVYTPAANYFGADSFTFKANDGTLDSNVATVTINVTAVNDAPLANNQNVTTAEDTALNIVLTATDVELNPLTYSIVTQPAHGTLTGTTPNVTYTPAANYFGADSFTFKANDGTADSNVATVSINVTAVNDAPLANPQSVTTAQNTAANITLTGSDVEGNPLTYSIVTAPTHGALSGTAPNVTYTPAAGYIGTDSFTFKANDGTADSNVATVSINVTAGANVPPVANPQIVPTAEDTAVNITLTATDANGDTLSYSIVTQPAHGTVTGTAPNVTYTPAANYAGTDSFTFMANDGQADSNVATVTINVTAVNDAPVADNQTVSTQEDTALNITLTGSDVEGNPLTYSIVTQPAHGTLSGTAPNVTYTPAANYAGTDSFTFKASDGTADSNVATVSINVTAVNDAPVANDVSASTAEGLPVNVTMTATDVDGDPLSYTVVTGPTHGVLSVAGAVVTYTPQAGYTGLDSFTFLANDGTVDSNVATATINVGAANNAPVADDQSVATAEDAAVNITLTATDGDGNPLSYSVVAQPTHGTLSGTAPNVTYTPAANYAGTDSFTFKANDGLADSNVATVTIVVNAVNDTPVANNQTVSTAEDTSVNITLTASDVDGDALTYEVVTPPQHGTLQGGGSALTYTPAANFFGTDTFTFKANDGQVDSNLATVTIQVSAVNDAPVASNQTINAVSGQPVNITLAATDAEGNPLTYTVVAAPQHGTLTGSGANLVYTPAAGFTGTDQLTFRASDGQATSNVATVTIQVTAGPIGTESEHVYLPLVKQ
ncbi:MAG: Ig-like domain-containing protein [Caldilineaceae bacterium]